MTQPRKRLTPREEQLARREPLPGTPRQRRQPQTRSYTADGSALADVKRRTKCQCDRPNPVEDREKSSNLKGPDRVHRYCLKCGKSL